MKIEIICPHGAPRGTRVYEDGKEITFIRNLKLEINVDELPNIAITRLLPDPNNPDEETGRILLDPITQQPSTEVLQPNVEELHFVGERFYRSHDSKKKIINLVSGIKIFAEALDTGEVIEVTNNLYFFEEQGIREVGGKSSHGEQYRVWAELPDDD